MLTGQITVFDVSILNDPDPSSNYIFEGCTVVPLAFAIDVPFQGGTVEVCLTFPAGGGGGFLEVFDEAGFTFQAFTGNFATYCKELTYAAYDPKEDFTDYVAMYVIPRDGGAGIEIIQNIIYSTVENGALVPIGNPQSLGFTLSNLSYNAEGVDLSTIATGGNSNNIFATPATSANTQVHILFNGILNVDIDYTMGNDPSPPNGTISSLHLRPDTRVIVEPGVHFQLNEVSVHGCRGMYDAFVVRDGGKMTVTESFIQDGRFAITVEDGGELYVEESEFFNNNIGIFVPPSTTGETDQLPMVTIMGSRFYQEGQSAGAGAVLLNNRLLPPFAGETSYAGAEFNDVMGGVVIAAIPGTTPTKNYFGWMENGIVFNRSDAFVSGSDFEYMQETANTPSGNGIVTRDNGFNPGFSNKVTIGSASPQTGNIFRNMPVAILAENNRRLDVFDANINLVKYGLLATNQGRLNFTDNSVTTTFSGIEMRGRSYYSISRILRNKFTIRNEAITPNVSSTGYGIKLDDLLAAPSLSSFRVRDNEFILSGGRYGFFGNNTRLVAIDEGNEIRWGSNSYLTYGIQLTGGDYPRLRGTSIVNNAPNGFTETTGIDLQNVNRPFVQCNTLENLETGISFLGTNSTARISGNDLLKSGNGLQLGIPGTSLEPLTIVGEQVHQANRFVGPFTGFGAAYETDLVFTLFNRFVVDDVDDAAFLPPSINITDWFENFPNDPTSNYGCPTGTPPAFTASELEAAVAAQYGNDRYQSGYWLPNQQLFQNYQDAIFTGSQSSTINDWVSEVTNNNIDKFVAVNTKINELAVADPATIAAIDSTLNLIWENTDAYVTTTLNQYPNNPNDTLLRQSRLTSLDNTAREFIGLLPLSDTLKAGIIQKIIVADADNGLLLTDTIFQTNLVAANGFLIEYLLHGLDSLMNNLATIKEIANQCPNHGGTGVYLARSLVSVLGEGIHYDDSIICAPLPEETENFGGGLADKLSIYPNPARGIVTVRSLEVIDKIELYDGLGRLVATQYPQVAGSITVPLENLVPGTYILRITDANDSTVSRKLNVQ